MTDDPKVLIRGYQPSDRSALRKISCETSFLELNRKDFFDDDEILADGLTRYFTDFEPQSCFVAESAGEVVGYIIGARNERKMSRTLNFRVNLPLFLKAFSRGVFLRKNNLKFIGNSMLSLIKGEFIAPDFSSEYPAILHINLAKGFRRQGLGRQLIEKYIGYLQENNVKGVHLATFSEKAKEFFMRQGFVILFKAKRSYLRYYIKADLPIYILGRKI